MLARAPCPMLNSLANHGFLPHHGRNLSRTVIATTLFDALHVNRTLGEQLFDFGLLTSPHGPNATAWSLDDLGVHNILEHDGSLSRSDPYFGSPSTFHQSVFNETKGYWGLGDVVDVAMAADARAGRIRESRRTNPTFKLSQLGRECAFGESVAYGGGVANRTWVECFFGIPRHFGWKRPEAMVVMGTIGISMGVTPPREEEMRPAGSRSWL
ncbi:Chloroperoxidase [Schizothecium vesticola]|uniref:Chloroperoxidase n=1 Tax=Schizothecium vesticola TaxID=314040 RepID=A0AA40K8V3_9PEZI|nr:Chloroperoxidase [Schizothecium vesticola]